MVIRRAMYAHWQLQVDMMMLSRSWWHRQIVDEDSIGGLTQDCSNSSALAMELLLSCAKQSIWGATSDYKVDIITTLNLYLHKTRAYCIFQITTGLIHLLFSERADWPKLHDMF